MRQLNFTHAPVKILKLLTNHKIIHYLSILLMPRIPNRPVVDACLEVQERMSKQDIKYECNGSCPQGFKSLSAGLLPHEENGKCDAAKHYAEFPNIGSHSLEQKANQWWPGRLATPLRHTGTSEDAYGAFRLRSGL